MKKVYYEFEVDFEDNPDTDHLSEDMIKILDVKPTLVPGTMFMELSDVESFNKSETNGVPCTTVRLKNGMSWGLKINIDAFARLLVTNGHEIMQAKNKKVW